MPPDRRAGSRWRILVHETGGERRAHDITSDPRSPARHAETLRRLAAMRPDLPPPADLTSHVVLEGTEFDELVVGRWIWLEQMDVGRWVLNVGGVPIDIRADRDGRPLKVIVHAPEDEWPRCEYVLDW